MNYFAVEIVSINGNRDLPRLYLPDNLTSTSFADSKGYFTLTDKHDRLWLCKEITSGACAEQLFYMGYFAHEIGIDEEGKMFYGNFESLEKFKSSLDDVKRI